MGVRMQRILLCVAAVIFGIVYLCANRRANEKDVSLKQLLAAAIRAAEIGGSEVVAVHDQIKFKIESKGQTREGNVINIKLGIHSMIICCTYYYHIFLLIICII